MALDQVVQNAAARLSTDDQLQKKIGAAVISNLGPELTNVVKQIESRLLDPTVNITLGDAIHGVALGAAKYGLNPQQWYNQLVEIYRQPMFGYGLGNSNLVYAAYLLASLYVSLQKSRSKNAQIYKDIVAILLAEILYRYYQSIGLNLSMQLIRAYIDWFANGLNGGHTGALNLAYSNALLRTGDPLFAQSSSTLISTLDNVIMYTTQSLIDTIYSKVQIPQVGALILSGLGQNGFYSNMFNYIYRKINDYIRQAMHQPSQQADQQSVPQQGGQQGQQANLPNTPPQQPVQVPQPHVIRPPNQPQQNQRSP